MEKQKTYIAIDLKSFYASVECLQRGLDPMTAHLVVADASRTSKTICLAVSPALKALGIPGRPRLFEVEQKLREINALRRCAAPGKEFAGEATDSTQLPGHPELSVGCIVAPPQMGLYMETSTAIYNVYLKYIAPEDIHVYSVDEVFIDATPYLKTYGLTGEELARKLIREVLDIYGITATAGIGTNLYLCKVAMDIVAKHLPADEHGVRIAYLDELSYREKLWDHRPLTDFWRIGPGYKKRLEKVGLHTMGDIARCSIGKASEFYNEDLLYRIFGVSAELLIDHAWGWESCTIADIKAYRPASSSLGSGQVLHCAYPAHKARLVLREMADALSLDLVDKGLVTDQIVLTVGYDIDNLSDPARCYKGPIVTDHYGRKIPRHSHGSINLSRHTASTKEIMEAVSALFDRIVDSSLLVRRLNITANHVLYEARLPEKGPEQLSLFEDPAEQHRREAEEAARQREKHMQQAMLTIKKKYGKNAILKGMSYEEGATARDRNGQIGGHKA